MLNGFGEVYGVGDGGGASGVRVDCGKSKIVGLEGGIDYCMMVSDKGEIFAQGKNYANLFGY